MKEVMGHNFQLLFNGLKRKWGHRMNIFKVHIICLDNFQCLLSAKNHCDLVDKSVIDHFCEDKVKLCIFLVFLVVFCKSLENESDIWSVAYGN